MNQDHYRALTVLLTQCALGGYTSCGKPTFASLPGAGGCAGWR